MASQSIRLLRRRPIAVRFTAGLCALLCALAQHLPGQIIITSPSITSLQTALDSGGNVLLNFNGTIATTTPLEIVFDTTLDGSGGTVTLSGSSSNRVFNVEPGVTLTLINVTVSGGTAVGATGTAGTAGAAGGNIGGNGGPASNGTDGVGGGIYNQGTLVLKNCVLTGNAAFGGPGGAGGLGGSGAVQGGNGGTGGNGGNGFGGAIYNLGALIMTNCSIAGNSATGGSGGVGGTNGSGGRAFFGPGGLGALGAGAGIYNLGSAVINDCTFNQNDAQGGLTQGADGKPQNSGVGANGQNGGQAQGGGIFNLGTNNIVNCTFWQNTVTGGNGGQGGNSFNGISNGGNGGNGGSAFGGNIFSASPGVITLTNCTVVNGSAIGGTGGAAGGPFPGNTGATGTSFGANLANSGGTFLLKNSLLSQPTNAFNASGAITDQGNNLSSDATPTFTTTNSFDNKDAKVLTPPAAHGGPTLTISLQNTSPAIDAIFDNSAPPTDQRGLPRPNGARSDIGAYEFGASSNSFTIAGTVMIGTNAFPGVTVKVGASSATTGTNGAFSLFLAGSLAYNVIPQPLGYFSPASTNITLNANTTNLVFTATNAATTLGFITNGGSNLVLNFSTIPTFTYRIQATTNLVSTNHPSTNWTDISTNTASNAVLLFNYTVTTNFPLRFFRAVTP